MEGRKRIVLSLMMFITASFIIKPAAGQDFNLAVYNSPEHMVAAAKEVITKITQEEFREQYASDRIYVVDVRTDKEHSEGAIPCAVNIPRGVLEFRIGQETFWEPEGKTPPEKDDLIVVYCRSGSRSALATQTLMQLGYSNVHSLEGGWEAWKKSDLSN